MPQLVVPVVFEACRKNWPVEFIQGCVPHKPSELAAVVKISVPAALPIAVNADALIAPVVLAGLPFPKSNTPAAPRDIPVSVDKRNRLELPV
jgi:hypothetical protein